MAAHWASDPVQHSSCARNCAPAAIADPSKVQLVAPTDRATPHGCAGYVPLHGAVLHACVSTRLAHAAPPCVDGVITLRVRVRVPELHGLVHGENALKLPTTQSTGHGCVLHARVSVLSLGHATPPCCGEMFTRVRDCNPVPQLFVHAPYAPQLPTTQSTGHVCALHGRVSCK